MDHYKPSKCKEVQIAAAELHAEIAELKFAISEHKSSSEKGKTTGKYSYLCG